MGSGEHPHQRHIESSDDPASGQRRFLLRLSTGRRPAVRSALVAQLAAGCQILAALDAAVSNQLPVAVARQRANVVGQTTGA